MRIQIGRFTGCLLIVQTIAALTACGGGDGSGGGSPAPTLYTVGGTVSGLTAGATMSLSNNGGDTLMVQGNGAFQFATKLEAGVAYAVAVTVNPSGEKCGVLNGTGTVSGAVSSVKIACAVPAVQLVAGGLGGSGNVDGPATGARFYTPIDVGYDAAGNWYVSDAYNFKVRKVDPSGNVTTLAGSGDQGTADGKGSAAQFSNPGSLAVDPSGVVYLVDAGVNTIRRIDTNGNVTTLAGTPNVSGTNDGTGAAAEFQNPACIRLDVSGVLYLTDNARIRKITAQGVVTTVYSGSTQLLGLALDGNGGAYVADLDAKSLDIVNLALGSETPLASGINNPTGVALAPAGTTAAGTVYVGQGYYSTIAAIAPGGSVSAFAGSSTAYGNVDGKGIAALLWDPIYMIAESSGTVLFADAGDNEIRQFTADATVTTRVGLGAHPGNVNGEGAAARFDNPLPLAADAAGNLYLSDANGIREVSQAALASTASTGGGGATGLALDAQGNAYFTQSGLNAIYKVSGSGQPVLFAGSGTTMPGSADGAGATAGFNHPNGITIDAEGNLFVVDSGNFTIRKITSSGVVTTLAGTASSKGDTDGNGSAARFWAPFAIAVDADDTLYVLDANAVRKVTASGSVTTLAGSVQTAGYAEGTGSAARFNGPAGIAIGPSGSLLVSDFSNHVIRQVSSSGEVSTVVGIAGMAGVKVGPLPTTLNDPAGLVYLWPMLYVVDEEENSLLAVSGIF